MAEPTPGTSLLESVERFADGRPHRITWRAGGRATAVLLDGEGEIEVQGSFVRWDNGGWAAEGYEQCHGSPEPW